MGSSIHGQLEHGYDRDDDSEPDDWRAAINVQTIWPQRDSRFYGAFFGVRNQANFEPVAANRGLPSAPSPTIKAQFPDGPASTAVAGWGRTHSHTWLRLDESIPWFSYARLDDPDGFTLQGWLKATDTSKYTRDGELIEHQTALQYQDGETVLSAEQFETLKRDLEVTVGEYRFKSFPRSRFELCYHPWNELRNAIDAFECLRKRDASQLRLVVWFSS